MKSFEQFSTNGGNERGASTRERKENPYPANIPREGHGGAGDHLEDDAFINKNDPEKKWVNIEEVPDGDDEDSIIERIDRNLSRDGEDDEEYTDLEDGDREITEEYIINPPTPISPLSEKPIKALRTNMPDKVITGPKNLEPIKKRRI